MRYELIEFSKLTSRQAWMIFKLRQEIFVLEQQCLFPEIDDRDPQALHLLGFAEDDSDGANVTCYCRLLAPGIRFDVPCISRVVVAAEHRRSGVGVELMQQAIEKVRSRFGKQPIKISAQQHLESFYQRLGFQPSGTPYLEDDIWHQDMELAEE